MKNSELWLQMAPASAVCGELAYPPQRERGSCGSPHPKSLPQSTEVVEVIEVPIERFKNSISELPWFGRLFGMLYADFHDFRGLEETL